MAVGQSYLRAEIAALSGLEFKQMQWQQGFVHQGGNIFLLVTLDKSDMAEAHRYGDRFLAPDLFEWKSQNRHRRESAAGQSIRHHQERETPVRLLVRKQSKVGGRGAPFTYCGEVDFVDWEGEKPITVRWRLRTPLSDRLAELFMAGA